MMTRWITGQQEHDWFPEPCPVYSSLEVFDNILVRKNQWIGPFTLDQAVTALWQVRSWNVSCSVFIDDGSGAEPISANGTYIAQWLPVVPNESYLNEADLDFRLVQPISGAMVCIFLTRDAIEVRHPSRVVYYDGGDGKDLPGYYLGGIIAADGAATGGYSYDFSEGSGINISWSLGSAGFASISMKKPDTDTRIYSGSISISPRTFWPY